LPHLPERRVILIDVLDPRMALEKISTACKNNQKPKLILDGLFGIGLSRPLNDVWQKLIAAVNESKIPVLAIDVPSGIDADTGEIRGAAIQAAITLTLATPKRGVLLPSAIPFIGRLEVASEIGLVPCPSSSELNWTSVEDFQSFPPPRIVSGHKGSFGHVSILAGSLGYHGAAVLAARGALRAQPGLVSVFTPENVYLPIASQLQAAMVHPWKTSSDVSDSCTAILFGPGFAATDLPSNLKREMLQIWTECPLPVIVDASALDWLPPGQSTQKPIRVITPHPGEAARMLSISTDAVQADRVSALRKLSARYGNCFVVLKGHQTLVGRNDGDVFINSSGNPFLAQGGSGDVLAGYISGLIAQSTLQREPLKTIRYAVWQHGLAADRLCDKITNWTIDDLLQSLGVR
ncbi:MAG: NAD(P)H-hydrate dehydratase, partial [Verrucomicrobiota bacterium]